MTRTTRNHNNGDRSQPTILDVAREAGVATSTVSRILAGSQAFSNETIQRVLDAVRRLNYVPSATARSLRSSRTQTIAVIVPDLANPLYAQYVRGAEHGCQALGYSLLICDAQNSQEVEALHLRKLFEHRVDGLLLAINVRAPEALNLFLKAGIPVEPEDHMRPGERPQRAELEQPASLAAFRCLIRLGHSEIALFIRDGAAGHPASVRGPLPRGRLLEATLKEAYGKAKTAHVVRVATPAECRAAVQRLAAMESPPTAFIAGTHVLAAPLLGAIRDSGLRIPQDVSFVTYGDSEWAAAYNPPISVIRYDYYQEARVLSERLVARAQGRETAPALPEFPSEFVQRSSCGPPRMHASGAVQK